VTRAPIFDRDRYSDRQLNRAQAVLLSTALDLAEHDRVDRKRPKLAELRAWDQLHVLVNDWMRVAASDAAKHHTWAEIGAVLGVSPQAAHKRLRRLVDDGVEP
jgi:Fic family protein